MVCAGMRACRWVHQCLAGVLLVESYLLADNFKCQCVHGLAAATCTMLTCCHPTSSPPRGPPPFRQTPAAAGVLGRRNQAAEGWAHRDGPVSRHLAPSSGKLQARCKPLCLGTPLMLLCGLQAVVLLPDAALFQQLLGKQLVMLGGTKLGQQQPAAMPLLLCRRQLCTGESGTVPNEPGREGAGRKRHFKVGLGRWRSFPLHNYIPRSLQLGRQVVQARWTVLQPLF